MQSKKNRMPPIPPEKMSEEQKKAAADIVSGPRGHLVGPFIPLMRSPEFMNRLQKTGEYLRFNSALQPRLSELAILMTARHWSQDFEWHHHRVLAEKAGLSAAACDALAEGRRPAGLAADESAIYDFVDELIRTRTVSDATWERAVGLFTERGVIDLIGLHGYYSLLAMILNATHAPLPEGARSGLKPLP